MKKIKMNGAVKERRKKALENLTKQLKSGEKNTENGVVDLTETDKNRIEKEIEILKTRI